MKGIYYRKIYIRIHIRWAWNEFGSQQDKDPKHTAKHVGAFYSPSERPGYDTKQSDGETSVMLEL